MTNNKYSFTDMLKIFGISKLFFCKEAYLSLLIPTILFYSMFYISPAELKSITIELTKFVIASDVAMLAIVISGFAIVLSVSGSNFLFFLNRKNLNIRFFFPFYLSSVLWGWHAIFSVALFMLVSTNIKSEIFTGCLIGILFLYISFFLYALLNSISLVRTILRLGFEKVKLDEKLGNINPKLLDTFRNNDT
ncbi:hypothetical protein ACH6EH_18120 [Paenibacillus sp. JSM ZJ436]|uniref:hypothetical protein n=1 Tax=Paenibacillus sp. JSM ZJ436 TaxID=3376190 RepID=UPI0037A45B05